MSLEFELEMVKCLFPFTNASKTQEFNHKINFYIGKPISKHRDECKHSSSLWTKEFFRPFHVWMKKNYIFQYIQFPSKLWMNFLFYH
jgi:hypothetical protein